MFDEIQYNGFTNASDVYYVALGSEDPAVYGRLEVLAAEAADIERRIAAVNDPVVLRKLALEHSAILVIAERVVW